MLKVLLPTFGIMGIVITLVLLCHLIFTKFLYPTIEKKEQETKEMNKEDEEFCELDVQGKLMVQEIDTFLRSSAADRYRKPRRRPTKRVVRRIKPKEDGDNGQRP